MTSMPQHQAQRPSFASRISGIFERRRAPAQDVNSTRATTTFEVPLFLSPNRYQPPQVHDDDDHYHNDTRSHSSTHSLIENAPYAVNGIRPLALSTSSRYSSRAASPALPQPAALPFDEPSLISEVRSNPSRSTARTRSTKTTQRRRKRRKGSLKTKIDGLLRVSAVFGITLFITLITYLVLAATGTATGIMFHVLMILFILSLTGVFVHSTIRFVILSRSLKARRAERRRAGHTHGHARQTNEGYFGEVYPHPVDHDEDDDDDEHPTEKAIRIYTADDDEEAGLGSRTAATQAVRFPPPVYGNFRSSKRINPNLVHWRKVPPSPLTPTYDEAMSDVHHVVGYRPPSYVQSESGATHIVEQGRRDVDQALKAIHPLERDYGMSDNVI